MTIKAVIIDDEPKARKLLSILLSEFCPQVQVVAECDDLPNGIKAIRKQVPDLVFLDIEMPGHSGLELLDFFNEDEVNFGIIFTTAYDEYAIQAFRLSAIDYLLKPINPELLQATVERFEKKTTRELAQYAAFKQNLDPQQIKKIAIPQGTGIKFISIDSILFIKGDGSYAEIYCQNNEKLLVSRNLKYMEELLEGVPQLVRCHKSYIANINHISEYLKIDGGILVMEEKHQIAVSMDKLDNILKLMSSR